MTTDARSYDAFLSYNRQDKALAQEVDAWLRSHSLRPFLDQNGLRPGFRWFPELQQAIDASGAMIVLVGAHGLGNTQQYEIDYALERQYMLIPHFDG